MRRTGAGIPILILAVLVALAARLFAAGSLGFDGLYGQDAFAYYYHGVALWHDHSPLYRWPWLPVPIRLFWPYGEPVHLALAYTVAGAAGTTPALAVSLLAGVGTLIAVYALCLDIAAPLLPSNLARLTATLPALLLGLSGLLVQASCTIMSDAPALFWGSLALWAWHSAGRCPRDATYGSRRPRRRAFAAGACLGMAFVTRYEYALLAAPLILAWWAYPAARRPHLVPAMAGLLPIVLPQLIVSAGVSPFLGHQWLQGWRPTNAWHTTFATPEGLLGYGMPSGVFYLARPLLCFQSLPLPLAPCAAVGILVLARAATGSGCPAYSARVSLATLAGWWLVPALYLSGLPYESSRYTLILLPPLAILEALGAATTLRWLASRLRPTTTLLLGSLWIGGSLAGLAAESRAPLQILARGKATDLAAVRQSVALAPPGAHLASFGLTLSLYHYGNLRQHRISLVDLSAVSDPTLRSLLDGPLLVVVDSGNLASQWTGRAPDLAFRYLREHRTLRTLRTLGQYTIYRATPRAGGR